MSLEYAPNDERPAEAGNAKAQPKPIKRKNVVIDDQHPFDLEAYIAQYTGQRS